MPRFTTSGEYFKYSPMCFLLNCTSLYVSYSCEKASAGNGKQGARVQEITLQLLSAVDGMCVKLWPATHVCKGHQLTR